MSAPLRVAIAGLGRTGLYHLEQLSLYDDCRVVAAYDVLPAREECALDFGCRFHTGWSELLATPDVDFVLVAAPPAERAELAIASLQAGKHVAMSPPFGTSLADADRMLAAAQESRRSLLVLPNRREDDDFRRALSVVRSGALGELEAVKFVVWDYAIPAKGGLARDEAGGSDAFMHFGADYFDQLLTLVPDTPHSVYSVPARPGAASPALADSFLTVVKFAGGVTAQVEVNLASPTRYHSGWVMTGTRGGYYRSKQSVLTDEGEIFETPVEVPPMVGNGFYDELVGTRHHEGPTCESARAARNAIGLIEAARESVRTGRVVILPPTAMR